MGGRWRKPAAEQQFLVNLRVLRDQRSRASTAGAAAEGGEIAAALTAAATSYRLYPSDDEQAASAIVAQVGWSLVRARWFLSVNQDRVRQTAARVIAEHPPRT